MAQSVILLADVPGLGQLGDQCNVKEGYARNYLIPNRLALFATSNNIKRFEQQKEKIVKEKEKSLAKAQSLAEKVSKVGLVYEKPMGEGGRLFGSVTSMDIAADLSQHGATVEKKGILMNGPIKSPGDHTIRVRIHSQVVVDVPVKIVGIDTRHKSAEKEAAEEEASQKEVEAKTEAKEESTEPVEAAEEKAE